LIDCDVHNAVPGIEALLPHLSAHWQEWIHRSGLKGPDDDAYPPPANAVSQRPGCSPGTELDHVRRDVLDHGAELAVLTCLYEPGTLRNPDLAAALASAVNDWQIEAWLDAEPRVRASVVVPASQPALAAAEIDRVGAHPGFVQVLLPVRSAHPYGTRQYHPLFDAAVRNELAVALHFGGAPGNPPTSSGWPSYYIEEYAGMPNVFQSQLQSLIAEGVFDRFPALRVMLAEAGFAWLPALLWRLDKEWRGLRREVPWVRRLPSEYVADHVRLTVRPVDCPLELLPRVAERLGSDALLLYASDYPHGHPESDAELLDALPEHLREPVMRENARAFYAA